MLNLWGATALVASGMIGAGILGLPSIMAKFGTWSIVSWFLSAAMIYSIATIFGTLGFLKKNKNASGPVEFIANAFGPNIGFIIACGYFVGMSVSAGYTARVFADNLLALLNITNYESVIAVLSVLAIFALNYFSSSSAGNLLTILTAIKVVLFLIIAICGLPFISNYEFRFGPVSDLFSATSYAIFTFLGIEFAALSANIIKDPEKNVMLSTRLGLLFSFLVFLGVYCSVIFVLPNPELSKTPVLDVGLILFGESAKFVLSFIGMLSCITTLNGIFIVLTNLLNTFASKKWIPSNPNFNFIASIIAMFAILTTIFINVELILACFFVAIVYLVTTFVYIKELGPDFASISAIISSLLIMYPINLSLFLIMALVYVISYIIKLFFSSKRRIK